MTVLLFAGRNRGKIRKTIHQLSWPSCREWNPRHKEYQARILTTHSVSTNNKPVSAVNNIKVPGACKITKVDLNINLLHIFTLKNWRFKAHFSCLHGSISLSLVAFQSWFYHLGFPVFQRLYQRTLCKYL